MQVEVKDTLHEAVERAYAILNNKKTAARTSELFLWESPYHFETKRRVVSLEGDGPEADGSPEWVTVKDANDEDGAFKPIIESEHR